jgi:isocitrate/isopropylmalate dehydrogenase
MATCLENAVARVITERKIRTHDMAGKNSAVDIASAD